MRDDAENTGQKQATEEFKNQVQDLKAKAKQTGCAAWDVTKSYYQNLQDKAANCSRATDQAIREKPYLALAIAVGVGVLIGALATRNRRAQED